MEISIGAPGGSFGNAGRSPFGGNLLHPRTRSPACAHLSYTTCSNTVAPAESWRLDHTRDPQRVASDVDAARRAGAEIELLSLRVSTERCEQQRSGSPDSIYRPGCATNSRSASHVPACWCRRPGSDREITSSSVRAQVTSSHAGWPSRRRSTSSTRSASRLSGRERRLRPCSGRSADSRPGITLGLRSWQFSADATWLPSCPLVWWCCRCRCRCRISCGRAVAGFLPDRHG